MVSNPEAILITEIKRRETRQALQAVFKVYRYYKEILRMGFEPLIETAATLPGYEEAAEPSTIRAQYKYSDGIKLAYDPWEMTERRLQEYIDKIDRKVNGLQRMKSEIIRRKFLCDADPIPTDDQVIQSLCDDGYHIGSKTEYERHKRNALHRLACSLGLENIVLAEI